MNKKEYSCAVSQAMDCMGYATENIKSRQTFYCKTMSLLKAEDMTLSLVGSKAEGLSTILEEDSDFDIMFEIKGCLCNDNGEISDSDKNTVLFKAVQDKSPPSYTMLAFTDSMQEVHVTTDPELKKIVGGYVVLGHLQEMLLKQKNLFDKSDAISGPAFTSKIDVKSFDQRVSYILPDSGLEYSIDCVLAISYTGRDFLQKWVMRKRSYDWPPKNLIEEISQMNGHVVPVGVKESEVSAVEWRICYTKAELKLTDNLNQTQMHLYALLKTVAKKLLKSVSKDISSYMIKNVVFWMAERIPQEKFVPETLMSFVMVGLKFLRYMLDKNWFPNYMIPERNMAPEKLSKLERDRVIQLLNEITAQGFGFVQNFKELQDLNTIINDVMNGKVAGTQTVPTSKLCKEVFQEMLLQPNFQSSSKYSAFYKQAVNAIASYPKNTLLTFRNNIKEGFIESFSQYLKTRENLKEKEQNGQNEEQVIYTRKPCSSDQQSRQSKSIMMEMSGVADLAECFDIQDIEHFEDKFDKIFEDIIDFDFAKLEGHFKGLFF